MFRYKGKSPLGNSSRPYLKFPGSYVVRGTGCVVAGGGEEWGKGEIGPSMSRGRGVLERDTSASELKVGTLRGWNGPVLRYI